MALQMGPVFNSSRRASVEGTLPSIPDHPKSFMSHDSSVAHPVAVSEPLLSPEHRELGHPPGMLQSTNGSDRRDSGSHTRDGDDHAGRRSPTGGRDTTEPVQRAGTPDALRDRDPNQSEFDPDARNSEPSPDVNLDFPSVEDVTDTVDGRHPGHGLLGGSEYVHPLAAAELAPGKVYLPGQAGKTGSVRSRGRVPDPLEVLPFGGDEAPRQGSNIVGAGSTRARRVIPHSSYYNGPPPLDSAYGSDPVGQIGTHYPREILRIERDYSGGELCQFHPTFPLELEGRITPVQHQESMNSINEVLISAHKIFPSFVYNAFAVLTLYSSTLFVPSHYDKEMQRLRLLIDQLNREIYNPQGLNILWPQKTAFLFLEIEYY